MEKVQIKYISFILLIMGTFMSYFSMLVEFNDIVLVFSFLLGSIGLLGLFHINKPNEKN